MTDILPFLRSADMATPEQRAKLCDAAADEIERLRRALKVIETHDPTSHVAGIARGYLKEP